MRHHFRRSGGVGGVGYAILRNRLPQGPSGESAWGMHTGKFDACVAYRVQVASLTKVICEFA